ncbi:MAG: HNH endonuclease [Clostridia bacterium]|nr:HNH endonuclease [Clostridia bacterium]
MDDDLKPRSISKVGREKMSEAKKKENNPNWKNGISSNCIRKSVAYKENNENALKRDKKQCRICGKESKLNVHHIKPVNRYPELACVFNNVITLCRDCHRRVEKKDKTIMSKYNEVLKAIGFTW